MKEVYIVTDGEYSDYRICAVFSNELDAEMYRKIKHYDNVETWDIDSFDLSKHSGQKYWYVKFLLSGEIEEIHQHTPRDEDMLNETHQGEIKVVGSYWRGSRFNNSDMVISVWAKDKDAAVKIASEYRMVLLGSHPECVELLRKSKWGDTLKLHAGEIEIKDIDA